MPTEDVFTLTKEPAGFVRLEYQPGIAVDLELAKRSFDATAAVGGRTYRLMIVMSGLKDVTSDGRDFLSKVAGPTHVAIVVSSPVDRIVANAFLAVAKPNYELHAFSGEAEAARWLMAG